LPTHFETPAMSTAVAEMDLAPENRNALSAGLSRLDRAQKIKMGLGAFGLLAIALASTTTWATRTAGPSSRS
jgi:hypothetical protein